MPESNTLVLAELPQEMRTAPTRAIVPGRQIHETNLRIFNFLPPRVAAAEARVAANIWFGL